METEMVGEIYTYIDLAYFAQDLCAIDDREFHDKKGISGFYKHDTEWGDNYEIYPIAWRPLPEPYKEAQNEKEKVFQNPRIRHNRRTDFNRLNGLGNPEQRVRRGMVNFNRLYRICCV